MKGLTKRQNEILTFIKDYIESHHYSPSYREIMDHFGLSSTAAISKHVKTLMRKGALVQEKYCSRSLSPTKSAPSHTIQSEVELPLIGIFSGENALEMFPNPQTLAVPQILVQNPEMTYVLRARGDLLRSELISDGDLILIEGRSEALDGETVLASFSEAPMSIRLYHPEGNYVRLTSQSSEIEPLMMRHEEVTIQGVIIGLLRLYTP